MRKLFTILLTSVISGNICADSLSSATSSWMTSLKGETKICRLTIPGTHDTGATSGGFAAKCQTASIKEQLESGIRFLDIRLQASSGKLELCHGIIGMGTYFQEDVIDHCKEFLDENPGETIIMSIKHDNGSEADYLSLLQVSLTTEENQNYLLKSLRPTTTLDDARGKIVCLHRNKPTWNYYGGAFNGFSDNTTFSNSINSYYGVTTSFKAQDFYNISKGFGKGVDYDGKFSAVTSLFNESYSDESNSWYFNFTSATALVNLAGPETIAEEIGPRVSEWLSDKGKGYYGVVVMDFANSEKTSGPEMTGFLIDCNKNYSDAVINNIETPLTDNFEILIEDNTVKVNGSSHIPEVYTLLGKRVSGKLTSGVYIVKVGSKAVKIKI